MKEKDLEKHLDNILIDGVIKEAEQDNADFAAAMRKISDEAFSEIIEEEMESEPAYESEFEKHNVSEDNFQFCYSKSRPITHYRVSAPMPDEEETAPKKSRRLKWLRTRKWLPWTIAAASTVVAIAMVLTQTFNHMSDNSYDSHEGSSSENIAPLLRDGSDIYALSEEEVLSTLNELEAQFDTVVMRGDDPDEVAKVGWELAMAYIKLDRKSDAIRTLKVVKKASPNEDLRNQCELLIDLLEERLH